MAKLCEKERAWTAELIEKVNKYLGDLSAKDEQKIGTIEGVLVEAVDDAGRAAQANKNTTFDHTHSPALQVVLGDAIWSHESASAEVLAAIRRLGASQLV